MMRSSTLLRFAFATHNRYLVIGGGTGGLNITSHLIRSGIEPHNIRVIDPSPYHYYQPGWTMIGGDQAMIRPTDQKLEETLP
jgi:sulfide:quinone oxidoreductase